MLNGKRIAVVMPAYNAAKTLQQTVHELPEIVDIRILVDDHSSDETVGVANSLGVRTSSMNGITVTAETNRLATERHWPPERISW